MKILQSSIIPAISVISLALAGSLHADMAYGTAVQDYTGSNNTVSNIGTVGSVTGTTAFGIRFSGSSALNANTITNNGMIISGTGVGATVSIGESGYGSAVIFFDTTSGTQAIGNVIVNNGALVGISGTDSYFVGGLVMGSSLYESSASIVANNTVSNNGLITVSGSAFTTGIFFSALTTNSNTLLNSGTISSISNSDALGIVYTGSSVIGNTITNSGLIAATAAYSGTDSYGYGYTQAYGIVLSSYGDASSNTITNSGQLTVTASPTVSGTDYNYADGSVYGIALWGGSNASNNIVTNSGQITATVSANSSNGGDYESRARVWASGITLQGDNVIGNTIANSGQINTTAAASASSINGNYSYASSQAVGVAIWGGEGGTISSNIITNSGQIAVLASSVAANDTYAEADGIYLSGNSVDGNIITNRGLINATAIATGTGNISSVAYGIGLWGYENVTGNTIANYGTITATGSNAYGIYFYGDSSAVSGNTITNYGNITVSGSNAYGIYLSAYSSGSAAFGNAITNWGTINASSGAGTAIYVEGDNNTITLTGHSSVQGLIQAVGDNNVLNLNFTGVSPAAKAALEAQLNAIGALSGTATEGTFTFRGVTYTYDPLIVNVTTSSYAEQAKTPNEKAVAANLDSFTVNPTGNMLAMLNALDQSGNVPRALDQLSPQRYQIYGDIALSNASLLTGLVDQRLNNVRFGSESIDTSSLGVTYGSVQSKLGMGSNGLPIVAAKDSKEIVTQGPDKRWSAFLSGNVGHASLDGVDGLKDSKYSDSGVIGGVDVKLTDAWTTGLLLGYAHTDAQLDTQGSSADVDAYSAGLYSGYRQGNFYGNGLAAYTYNTYDSGRVVDFGSYSEKASGHTTGSQFTVNLDGGYDQPVTKNISAGPFVGLQYVHLGVDGFNESQAKAANLNINDQAMDSLRSRAGLRVELKKDLSKNWKAASELRVAWQHEFANNDRAIVAQFGGSGLSSFAVRTSDPERDRAVLGIGLNATCRDTLTAFVDYDAEIGTRYTEQIFKGGLKYNF